MATLDGRSAYKDADFVVIAAPTNYDSKKNFFDTTHVEEVIELVLEVNPSAVMVIKSTIPVGYTKSAREKFSYRERQADGSRHPFDSFICAKTPAGRWLDPEELAGPAVFLASHASDAVNGHILYVDGGILAYIGKQPK